MTRDQRRLAAIVSADVAGYSRLMGQDESGTLAVLKDHRRALIDPKIAEYGGRIVKSTGDGLLLEFPSVVDAVRCAVDVQRGMAERNAAEPPERRIEFRIGINVGDIIIDGDDIYGDGVNVAARLQTLSEPGGICASKVVRDQVLDKLSFAFEDLGKQQVKNISRPVEVYRVDLAGEPSAVRGNRWRQLKRGPWRWIAAGLAAVGVAGIAVWMLPQLLRPAPDAGPPPLSVAILPFVAAPGEQQLADAIGRDLTLGLGRTRGQRVASSAATERYKGKPADPRSVGAELSVRYLTTGEVRSTGDRMVIDVQLIEAATAAQVWSDRVEVEAKHLPGELNKLVARLTHRIDQVLFGTAAMHADKSPPANASAIEFVLHAHNFWARNPTSVHGAAGAIKFFDQALERDPNLVSAMVGKFAALYYLIFLDSQADHARLVKEMDELSLRAATVDERDPDAWWARAIALAFQWRWQAALEANAQAERLDPTNSGIFSHRAEMMLLMGRPTDALALVDKALALEAANTVATAWPLHTRCRTYVGLGRYDEAIAPCEKSAFLHEWWMPHLYLVAVYTHQGETAKAEAEKAKVLQQRPGISLADFNGLRLSDNSSFLQQIESKLFGELRRAGIPER
jgi:class 3 adenylate cyclase/TolB-like protein/tetratricopeptide (TPR) repeat protein